MNTPTSDLGIPILTEVIGPQSAPAPAANPASQAGPAPQMAPLPERTPFSLPPALPAAPAPAEASRALQPASPTAAAAPATAAVESQAPSPWKNSELGDLEKDLRDRITRQVLGRIDFVLDHRVRNTLTDVVDNAIDTLAGEIKRGLHETLTDIVARAVAQEISRLQSAKK